MELRAGPAVIRDWRPEDAAELAREANDRRIWINLRDAFPHPYGLADGERFIARARAMDPPTFFAVEVDGSVAGGIGYTLHGDVERVGAEVGYWLAAPHWGRGIATAAVRALSAHAFAAHPELRRLYALPYATNAASARVLEKAGYRLEGRLRENVVKDGRVLDSLLYARLRGEHEAEKGEERGSEATTATVFVGVSVDGFMARRDGALDFLPPGGGEPHGYDEFMATVDALVIGRNTFETVLGFDEWPYGRKRVVVLSHRPLDLSAVKGGRVEQMGGAPAEIVARLAKSGARHLYVDGGLTIQEFLRAGLIQRLVVTRVPVLIGEGIPLFGALPRDVRLVHVATRAYSSGLVQSEYRVAAPDTPAASP